MPIGRPSRFLKPGRSNLQRSEDKFSLKKAVGDISILVLKSAVCNLQYEDRTG